MKTCMHNIMIFCEDQNKCAYCGWDPEVMAARKAATREQFADEKEDSKNADRRIQ